MASDKAPLQVVELQRSTNDLRRSSIAARMELQRSTDGVRRNSIATPAKLHCNPGYASGGLAVLHFNTGVLPTASNPYCRSCDAPRQQRSAVTVAAAAHFIAAQGATHAA